MKARCVLWCLLCSSAPALGQSTPATTSGPIAVANLEQLLVQAAEPAARIDLLLAKSRLLGDYEALSEAETLGEGLSIDAEHLLLRARTRAAVHRFDEALRDLQLAERHGAKPANIASQRASILVATGHVTEVLASLESMAAAHPGHASHSTLAGAYAELGRYAEADAHYHAALDALHTTSPFPHAWIHFALGLMWTEQAGDAQRGEIEYAQALQLLPQFVVANIHKAEIEVRRGDLVSAEARLSRVIKQAQEPEALALRGAIRRQRGEQDEAEQDIAMAAQRFQSLLARHPLAFVDHAAEYYLTVRANPRHALELAQRNLENRQTPRAFALAIRAALASGYDACAVRERLRQAFDDARLPANARGEWERRAGTAALAPCAPVSAKVHTISTQPSP